MLTRETRVEIALDDMESTIHQSLVNGTECLSNNCNDVNGSYYCAAGAYGDSCANGRDSWIVLATS